jgi:hypothetical protein
LSPPLVYPATLTIVLVDTKCVCDESRRITGLRLAIVHLAFADML